MRIYIDALEMVKEVERDLFEMGIRYQTETVQDQHVGDKPEFKTIELYGYTYTLKNFDKLDKMLDYMKAPIGWIQEEKYERLLDAIPANNNPGRAWKLNPELWEKFLRDGKFSYSYAERWKEQLPYIINELKLRPNSRQAIMTMYDRHQDMMNWGGRDRVPCSLTYQFLIRNGKLNLLYSQRSCDFITFFTADVYLTIALLKHVAASIGIEEGFFIHFIGSLHAFAKDLEGRNIF